MLIDWVQMQRDADHVWFTADQHFGHANVIKFSSRPFANVEQMDRALIDNWNAMVGSQDVVFHLGDFTLGNVAVAEKYFRQLNGRIFVLANEWHHDHRWLGVGENQRPPCFVQGTRELMRSRSDEAVQLLPPMVVMDVPYRAEGHPLAITLCHYPVAEWDRKHYGAWHLHGHSHGKHQHTGDGFILDVGVDALGYSPISLGGVMEKMSGMGWA